MSKANTQEVCKKIKTRYTSLWPFHILNVVNNISKKKDFEGIIYINR